jgi:hypothetical protein
MSRDEFFLPTVTGAGQDPEQGCPDTQPYDIDGMTLRRQGWS